MEKFHYLGLDECDRKRNKTNPDVIILPEGGGDGSKGVDPNATTFQPVVPKWPTKSGVTLQNALSECKAKLEGSITYKTCQKVLGIQFRVKVVGIFSQCIADIQVSIPNNRGRARKSTREE